MILCAVGDIDPKRVAEAAQRILPAEAGERPERDFGPAEGEFPVEGRVSTVMEIGMPMFCAGSKAGLLQGEAALKRSVTASLALEILMGESSPLYARLYRDGLINSGFFSEFESSRAAAYTIFGGESREPDAVLDAVCTEAARIAADGPDETLFRRLKKAAAGEILRGLNLFDNVCYNTAIGYFNGYDAFSSFSALSAVTPEEISEFAAAQLQRDRLAISIVSPHAMESHGDPLY